MTSGVRMAAILQLGGGGLENWTIGAVQYVECVSEGLRPRGLQMPTLLGT